MTACEIVHCRGKGALFLLDGWGELPEELQRESLFRTLIGAPHKYSLSRVALMVSACPVSSTGLQ